MGFGTHPDLDRVEGIMFDNIDGGRPDELRAKFTFRFITGADEKRLALTLKEAWDLFSTGKREDRLKAGELANEALLIGLRGWENVRSANEFGTHIPFSPGALDELPLLMRLRIATTYPTATDVSALEKKDSPSPSPSDGTPPDPMTTLKSPAPSVRANGRKSAKTAAGGVG